LLRGKGKKERGARSAPRSFASSNGRSAAHAMLLSGR
jgi:hypothetical protein